MGMLVVRFRVREETEINFSKKQTNKPTAMAKSIAIATDHADNN